MNMNMPVSNAPTPSSGGSKSFFQVWIDALTKPNENTFAEMASSPNAKAMTAYIWVFVTSLIELFFSFLVNGALVRRAFDQGGFGGSLPGGGVGIALIGAVCGGPIFAVVITIFFAIGTALVQWIAKMFGGKGTNDQLTYTFGAIAAPVLFDLNRVCFAGSNTIRWNLFPNYHLAARTLCFGAIHHGNKGCQPIWLGASGWLGFNSYAVVVFLVCCCLGAIASMAAGAGLKGFFQQLQQSGAGS